MNALFVFYVALAAFLGSVSSALLTWLGSSPPVPFNPRTFGAAIIRALFAAAAIGESFNYATTSSPVYVFVAFLAGAGVDSGSTLIYQAMRTKSWKKGKGNVR